MSIKGYHLTGLALPPEVQPEEDLAPDDGVLDDEGEEVDGALLDSLADDLNLLAV